MERNQRDKRAKRAGRRKKNGRKAKQGRRKRKVAKAAQMVIERRSKCMRFLRSGWQNKNYGLGESKEKCKELRREGLEARFAKAQGIYQDTNTVRKSGTTDSAGSYDLRPDAGA